MSSTFVEDGAFVNSIVGEGTRFNGELDLNGLLRIDGDFTGSIKTGGKVLIGKNGRAKCTISASTVVVGGAVRGDIYSSEKVIVLSSGIILGNIFTPRLIVEEGVILDGNCSISRNYGKKESEPGRSVAEAPETAENMETETSAEEGPGAGEYDGSSAAAKDSDVHAPHSYGGSGGGIIYENASRNTY